PMLPSVRVSAPATDTVLRPHLNRVPRAGKTTAMKIVSYTANIFGWKSTTACEFIEDALHNRFNPSNPRQA
ncbi:MAG: hypothetical protein ACREBC_38910, partial [Pyrinomonadaceae bacterium]